MYTLPRDIIKVTQWSQIHCSSPSQNLCSFASLPRQNARLPRDADFSRALNAIRAIFVSATIANFFVVHGSNCGARVHAPVCGKVSPLFRGSSESVKFSGLHTMFTGLIETIGTILEFNVLDGSESGGNGVSMIIGECLEILVDVHLGDSISTNGVCLTVTEFDEAKTQFKVGIAPETLRRSNLGDLQQGSRVNLERAVTSEVRLGGHVVQGHVDTVASIVKRQPDGNSIAFTFRLRDTGNINYIVEKGFIAIDGTSLTVTGVDYESAEFSIMLISYSQAKVVLSKKEVGDTVNIEVDYTGKLIEKQVELTLQGQMRNKESPLVRFITEVVKREMEK